MSAQPRRDEVFGAAIVAALIALAVAFGAQRGHRALTIAAHAGEVTELGGPIARYTFFPTAGRVDVVSADGRSRVDVEMSLVVDGVERPLAMRRSEVHLRDKMTLAAIFPIDIGEDHAAGTLELRMDPASDLLTASLTVQPESGGTNHTYALRWGMAPQGRPVFIPGSGETSDFGTVEARTVVIDDDAHPFALVSSQGLISMSEAEPETNEPGATTRLIVSGRTETATLKAKPARMELSLLVGAGSQSMWGRLYRLLRGPVGKVSGVVTGTRERAHVVGLDEDGRALVRAMVDPQGKFSFDAPMGAVQWYAALEASHMSAPVRFVPGGAGNLTLDVSPGGEVHIKVIDADTGLPLLSRLNVHGVDGTLDPNFGPDYRASGAGPLMDLVDGEVSTPLPSGHYRILATKGIEWSIDAETVDVTSGHARNIELALRHVVPTPGLIGCDLHVHARPSFDTPVTTEDRILSLISAGIDFAVPTEHNVVGNYTNALEVLKMPRGIAHTQGVEITTYNPRFGHFGVFPYPTTVGVPPYKGTSASAVFGSAHRGDPTRVFQVNHPRMQLGIGYFNIVGFDPKSGRIPPSMRADFDTLEVYSGFEQNKRELTERVLEDWYSLLNMGKKLPATGSSDSHRIQYQWAGYPRTYVSLDPKQAGDTGQPIDVAATVAAIKKGNGFVTSGPIIEFEATQDGKTFHPGDEVTLPAGAPLVAHLRIRSAPWSDLTSVEVLAGSPPPKGAPGAGTLTSVTKLRVESKPTAIGKETGTLEESNKRTIRLDTDLTLNLPEGARWLIVLARGERPMDDVLPFMPIQPFGFTNPIYIQR